VRRPCRTREGPTTASPLQTHQDVNAGAGAPSSATSRRVSELLSAFAQLPTFEMPPDGRPKGEDPKALEDVSMCSICYNDYSENPLCSTLPCGHTFHRDCMRQWLQTGRSDTGECPLCKAPLLIDGVPVSQLMAARFEAMSSASAASRATQSCRAQGSRREGDTRTSNEVVDQQQIELQSIATSTTRSLNPSGGGHQETVEESNASESEAAEESSSCRTPSECSPAPHRELV